MVVILSEVVKIQNSKNTFAHLNPKNARTKEKQIKLPG
jgi:hypothetical protein